MPELKTFDIGKMSIDVYNHRNGLKLSRKDYAIQLGLCSAHTIEHIEARRVSEPPLIVTVNICNWMGKDIKEYFV